MGLPGSNEDNFLIEDVDDDDPHDDNDTERSMEDSYNRYVALEESTTISIRSTPIDYTPIHKNGTTHMQSMTVNIHKIMVATAPVNF